MLTPSFPCTRCTFCNQCLIFLNICEGQSQTDYKIVKSKVHNSRIGQMFRQVKRKKEKKALTSSTAAHVTERQRMIFLPGWIWSLSRCWRMVGQRALIHLKFVPSTKEVLQLGHSPEKMAGLSLAFCSSTAEVVMPNKFDFNVRAAAARLHWVAYFCSSQMQFLHF